MLKINKNQIVLGQKMVVDSPLYKGQTDNKMDYGFEGEYLHDYHDSKEDKDPQIPLDTVLTLIQKPDAFSSIIVEDDIGNKYQSYWSTIKGRTNLGPFPNLGANKVEYRILLDGVDFKKKKFKDIGKVKASLMSMMDYHRKFSAVAKLYDDRCPENKNEVEYFFHTQDSKVLNRTHFLKLELFEVINNKAGKKVNFDFVGYYDEMMKLLTVGATFGSAARETFKNALTKTGFKTILVFIPNDYYTYDYNYYKGMGENKEIKNILKTSNIQDYIKQSKMGKTAIAFKSDSDCMRIISLLPKKSYYILNMDGDELTEKTEQLVIQHSRKEKLENILKNIG